MVDKDAVPQVLEYFPLAKQSKVVQRRITIGLLKFSVLYLKLFADVKFPTNNNGTNVPDMLCMQTFVNLVCCHMLWSSLMYLQISELVFWIYLFRMLAGIRARQTCFCSFPH